jgi:thymidylate synthase (FAD)
MDSERMNVPLARASVPELDAVLGKKFACLDDGFVRVVDYLGADASIVLAARISYGTGTRAVHEDRGLIRYLLRHRHTTPFEMCEIKFHVRVPMDTWRQWIRHRTANVNEYSTRYSVAIDNAQKTPADAWRLQSLGNRQGSSGSLEAQLGERLSRREAEFQRIAREIYNERLEAGVAREQARKDLPLSTYTEAYWKIDLWNLMHFLGLRMDLHAQAEIREYANIIGNEIVATWVPAAWEAFQDYELQSVKLSRSETAIMSRLLAGDRDGARRYAASLGWLETDPASKQLRRSRERDEFLRKLSQQFSFSVDWLDASQEP